MSKAASVLRGSDPSKFEATSISQKRQFGNRRNIEKSACGKVEQVWLIGKSNLSRSCASRQSAEGKKFPNGLPSFPLAHTLSVRVKNSCRRPPPPPASNLNLRL